MAQEYGNISYRNHRSADLSASYPIALKAMAPVYKDFSLDAEPLIGIGEIDLNGDKLPEIISFPIEEYEQEGDYCPSVGLCPHYVLEVNEGGPSILAILFAYSVETGPAVVNGYRTLRARTGRASDTYETYIYKPARSEYVLTR